MKKRNLFAELTEGFEALATEREGKITLKQHVVEIKPVPEISADELVRLRQKLNLSRSVFARYLRINERTLENWNKAAPIQMLKRHYSFAWLSITQTL